jgi:hypothetical protein
MMALTELLAPIAAGMRVSGEVVEDAAVRPQETEWARFSDACIEKSTRHEFWYDDLSFAGVQFGRVIGHRQVTDAYLAQLARHRNGQLAALDGGLAHLHSDAAARPSPALYRNTHAPAVKYRRDDQHDKTHQRYTAAADDAQDSGDEPAEADVVSDAEGVLRPARAGDGVVACLLDVDGEDRVPLVQRERPVVLLDVDSAGLPTD